MTFARQFALAAAALLLAATALWWWTPPTPDVGAPEASLVASNARVEELLAAIEADLERNALPEFPEYPTDILLTQNQSPIIP